MGLNMKRALLASALALWCLSAHAHRSGCHRWHSCESDHGTYVCGDTGHCSGCADNQYCKDRQIRPRNKSGDPKPAKPTKDPGNASRKMQQEDYGSQKAPVR